ncbi:universal stress protein [Nonomuraea bangladeshensis]|uniref:universal stress protein n=1 Tax=Nonomuraea bangladeshensis TaxID=404385 RepID=UPI003F4DF8C4
MSTRTGVAAGRWTACAGAASRPVAAATIAVAMRGRTGSMAIVSFPVSAPDLRVHQNVTGRYRQISLFVGPAVRRRAGAGKRLPGGREDGRAGGREETGAWLCRGRRTLKAGTAADLVVMGSRGRGALAAAVLASVSMGVLHHATSPVAAARRARRTSTQPPAREAPRRLSTSSTSTPPARL